jgi:hypothetical protein
MPLDNLIWFDDDWNRWCIGWKKQFALFPRRCYYTGKYLWLKPAYKGTAMITGPGEPVFESRWCDSKEYLFLKIKGVI